MEQLMDVKQTASFLNVSIHTIRRWVKREEIPFIPLGKRRKMFSPGKIQEWLNGLSVTPGQSRKGKKT